MKILWWNVGHAFFEKPSNFIKLYKGETMDCFYDPLHGPALSGWIKKENYDVVCLTEITSAKDLESFNLPEYKYKDWIPSASHAHGRAIISKIPFTKANKQHGNYDVTTYDIGDTVIIPVHFHWADTNIRMEEVISAIQCINEQVKPVVLVGDFNMWSFMSTRQIWSGDRKTFKILNRELIELSKHITTTEMIPGFKLDYVFTQPDNVEKFTVERAQNYPKLGMDHKPLEINF